MTPFPSFKSSVVVGILEKEQESYKGLKSSLGVLDKIGMFTSVLLDINSYSDNLTIFLRMETITLHMYPMHLQMCPREREPIVFTKRGVI